MHTSKGESVYGKIRHSRFSSLYSLMRPDTNIPKHLKILIAVLFIALVPVFLTAISVRWVINFPPLYSYGFDQYDIPRRTGIERVELISAGKQIRDYFNNDVELLELSVVLQGARVQNLYNEREVLHMRDVKALVQGVYRVSEFSGLYLFIAAAVGFGLWGRLFAPSFGRLLIWGGGVTLALVGLVGLGAMTGFDRLFLAFHLISFSNDLWQLDPRRDYLIAMFPQSFFFDATMLIALTVILQAVALVAIPAILLKRRERGAGFAPSRAERRRARGINTA